MAGIMSTRKAVTLRSRCKNCLSDYGSHIITGVIHLRCPDSVPATFFSLRAPRPRQKKLTDPKAGKPDTRLES